MLTGMGKTRSYWEHLERYNYYVMLMFMILCELLHIYIISQFVSLQDILVYKLCSEGKSIHKHIYILESSRL